MRPVLRVTIRVLREIGTYCENRRMIPLHPA
jgi:hypothetical protein